jgi:hypothetical protein
LFADLGYNVNQKLFTFPKKRMGMKKTTPQGGFNLKYSKMFYLNLLGDFLSHSTMMGLATKTEE